MRQWRLGGDDLHDVELRVTLGESSFLAQSPAAPGPTPATPLAEALRSADPGRVRALCERTGLSFAALRNLGSRGRHVAGWLQREIAEIVGVPECDLFRQPARGDGGDTREESVNR